MEQKSIWLLLWWFIQIRWTIKSTIKVIASAEFELSLRWSQHMCLNLLFFAPWVEFNTMITICLRKQFQDEVCFVIHCTQDFSMVTLHWQNCGLSNNYIMITNFRLIIFYSVSGFNTCWLCVVNRLSLPRNSKKLSINTNLQPGAVDRYNSTAQQLANFA